MSSRSYFQRKTKKQVQHDLRAFLGQVVASRDEPATKDLHSGLDDLVFGVLGHLRSILSHQPGAVPTPGDILNCRRRLLDLSSEIEQWWTDHPAQEGRSRERSQGNVRHVSPAHDLLEMKAQLGLYREKKQQSPAPPPGPSPQNVPCDVPELPSASKVEKVERPAKVETSPEVTPATVDADVPSKPPSKDPPGPSAGSAPQETPGRPGTPDGEPPGPMQLPGMMDEPAG